MTRRGKRMGWWLVAIVVALTLIAPGQATAARKNATPSTAKQSEVAGGCGDVAPEAGVQLPPGVPSPLARLMPDDGCYEPLRTEGGKSRRCEPQCIPYIRCRSGIDSCRTGIENGPLTWFACEERRGNTGLVPQPGSVLILAANARRKMPTGHGLYVEEVIETAPALYRLILSHTNYDRRCSLETNIEAQFDRQTMTVDFLSGAWHTWGRELAVAGFIFGGTEQATP